jgi:GT2 family glycosyltransferase
LKAAIVILNYNGRQHLEKFLPSVVATCPEWGEIIVADNASADDSISFLKSSYPKIRLIELKENHGFAGGYNIALKAVDAEYFAILNSDVEVTGNWLEILVSNLAADDSYVAAQPKIRDFSKREYFEYAGACGGFIDKYGYPFCRGRLFSTCERDIGQHNESREVFWASGACLVIKSQAFWEVNGFDESLFAHMEEIDLCWRLKNRGKKVFCFPEAVVFHLGGGTLSAQSPKKTFLNFRNNLSIILKNDYRKNFFIRFLKRQILDGLAAAELLRSRGVGHFLAVIKAHFSFYGRFFQLQRKRKSLKSQISRSNYTGYFKKSLVKEYFIAKKKAFSALSSRDFIRQDRKR